MSLTPWQRYRAICLYVFMTHYTIYHNDSTLTYLKAMSKNPDIIQHLTD